MTILLQVFWDKKRNCVAQFCGAVLWRKFVTQFCGAVLWCSFVVVLRCQENLFGPIVSMAPEWQKRNLRHTMGQNRKKHRTNNHLIIHFPISEGVSKVSKRVSEWAQRSTRAKWVVRSKQTNEWCKQMSERTSKWPSTSVYILGCSGPQWISNTFQLSISAALIATPFLRLEIHEITIFLFHSLS